MNEAPEKIWAKFLSKFSISWDFIPQPEHTEYIRTDVVDALKAQFEQGIINVKEYHDKWCETVEENDALRQENERLKSIYSFNWWCPYCKEYIPEDDYVRIPDDDNLYCSECSSPLQNNRELTAENERLRAALEKVEWVKVEAGVICPWCRKFYYAPFDKGEVHTHRPDCQRQAALGKDVNPDYSPGVREN